MKVEFVNATETDLERIVSTYNKTVPGRMVTADTEPVSVESKYDWFNAHNPDKRHLLTVVVDDAYAGWMSFTSFYGRPAYDGTVEVSIYLEPEFQKRGLGKICLQHAEKIAPKSEVKTLLGFIFGHNEPSLRLFYKCGYEKWAHLPKIAVLDDVWRDLIIVGKHLVGKH